MALTKPNQELRNDLRAAALAIESVAQELFSATKSSAEPEFYVFLERIGTV